uniref:Cytochrome P450 9e2-like n=1 Tax=Hirondellea gigas TaxID=1518452 RepID=A0A2P2I5F2_9CRUS
MQELVRQNNNGKLNYQDIMEAKYLDAVLSETLRLYPPGHVIERQCTKEYNIPGTSIIISEGQIVSFPVYSIHRDERYYPNPEEFQPDRFLPENRKNIPQGAFLPFGVGPRMCIAQRFAQMESKLALAELVLKYRLSLAEGYEQLSFDTSPGIMRLRKGTVMIKLEEVKNE